MDRAPFPAQLLESKIEQRRGIRPFIRALQQDQVEFLAVARGRRRKGVARPDRPARFGRPHPGVNAQQFIVVLESLQTDRSPECQPGGLTNFTQDRKSTASAAANIFNKSRAVVTWPGAGNPFGFLNKLLAQPNSAARAFISATKIGTDPPVCRANANAESLSEPISKDCTRVFTGTVSPACNGMRLGSTSVSAGAMTTTPCSRVRSATKSAVSSLTVLAGGSAMSGFRLNKIRPVAASTNSTLAAWIFRSDPGTRADGGLAQAAPGSTTPSQLPTSSPAHWRMLGFKQFIIGCVQYPISRWKTIGNLLTTATVCE